MKSNRILIIGLDGATWDVLTPWINDGSLPNLAQLRRRGSWGVLRSTIPPITAPAWSTFMTGKRPGKHGLFHFVEMFGNRTEHPARPEIVNARSLKSPTLWDVLGHHHRQVGLINVPMTYPPRPVNGFMITGLLTPRNAPIFTYPAELSGQITDYIIDLDRFIDIKPFQGAPDPQLLAPSLDMVQEFQDMLDKRGRASMSLMRTKPWDVFMVVFTGTDRMGHYLWPYHRSPTPADEPVTRQLCQAVHNYYRRLDEIVGELVHQAGNETTILVISDHGMGLRPRRQFYGNNWLHRQGWLAIKSTASGITNPDGWLRRLGIPRDKIGRLLMKAPGFAKRRLVKQAVNSRSMAVDSHQSRAVCIPMYNNIMGIKINDTGEQKEALYRQITGRLQQIVDPETGQKVVREIYRGEDYYRGPYAAGVPDILVVLDADYRCNPALGHYSSLTTRLQVVPHEGGHRMEGIFTACGPGIQAHPDPLPNLAIEDIAPTVLHLMGLPVPLDMDGRVLTEILHPAEARPVEQSQPTGRWPSEQEAVFLDQAISTDDEEEIRARLEALGYLE